MQSHSKIVQQDSVISPRLHNETATGGELSAAMAASRPSIGGCLIINADDWGRDAYTTDRTLECFQKRALSSASGMVFMEDSVRGASIANEHGLDIGLHLNLSTPFSAHGIPTRLANHQQDVRKYLCANRFARLLYHPGLANSFEYAVAAQIEEFNRLYGRIPDRIDGHHHMHLAANVLFQRLLPSGTIVRRHFSYEPDEKIFRNSIFRMFSRTLLGSRHRITDFFFSLPPLEPAARLRRIFDSARQSVVEVETHPVNPEEYRFLTGGELLRWAADCPPALNFGKVVRSLRAEDRVLVQ